MGRYNSNEHRIYEYAPMTAEQEERVWRYEYPTQTEQKWIDTLDATRDELAAERARTDALDRSTPPDRNVALRVPFTEGEVTEMSEHWMKHDRPCAPCPDCGAELYEKFWGNGGWARTDRTTERTHGSSDCVKALKSELVRLRGYIRQLHGGIAPSAAIIEAVANDLLVLANGGTAPVQVRDTKQEK